MALVKTSSSLAPLRIQISPSTTFLGRDHYSADQRILTVARSKDGMNKTVASWSAKLPADIPPPKVTKTDAAFTKEGLEFVWGQEGLSLTDLNDLFEKVGFPRRDPQKLTLALSHTHKILWIRSLKQSRVAKLGQLIGFARATSDGVFNATVWDVAVLPSWQRGGLGRALMERIVKALVEDGISTITLYAEPNVVKMYSKLGFKTDPDGIKGIAYLRQSNKIQV